jgi:hypothetical protein
MASLDLGVDYKKIQDKVTATRNYNELKTQYDDTRRQAGETFEQKKAAVTGQLGKIKEQTKRYQKEIKNQFEQLLDLANTTGGVGSGSPSYIKRLLITALKNIEPKLSQIALEESINAVGCDQQQAYNGGSTYYIKVKSIDLLNILTLDPKTEGKPLYEKDPILVQDYPFSMNKELYRLIQTGQPYSADNGQNYIGQSGQDLFDIQYLESRPDTGETGPWFKVDLSNRVNGVNKVGTFLVDYYKTVRITEPTNMMASIMESLSGVVSMNASAGVGQVEDQSKFDILIQRILGLCFDNRSEIDVSGIAKVPELDGVDETFFEFTDIDLRKVDQRVTNIKNKVIELEECDNILLPVDFPAVIAQINNLNLIDNNSDFINAADNLTQVLADNPQWGAGIQTNAQAALNLNFIKLIAQGIAGAFLTPKVLLPIYVMLKAIGQETTDAIKGLVDFAKQFKRFAINFISKIGALFVQELFELIKRDILLLIQRVISDIVREKIDKRISMILKLIQLLLIVASFISDWRKCKSVVDELLALLDLITSSLGFGGQIPLPLLFASQLLDGYSESRAFVGAIEELQKIGVPTGALPDGSPNLDVLGKFGQMKAMAREDSDNNKVQMAIGPLTITPAGLTVPSSAFGKKL